MFSGTDISILQRIVNLLCLLIFMGICLTTDIQAQNVFQKIYDTAGIDYGQNLHRTLDDGYIIGGVYSPENSSVYHPFLLKLNSDWSVEWYNIYGEFECDYVSYTQVCDDETFALAGQYHSENSGSLDIFLIKVDYLGNVVKSYTYDYSGDQVVRTFRKTTDGGFLVGGRWTDDSFIMKMDRDFKPVWINILGGYNTEVIYACQVASDSEFVAAGYTMSYGMGDADILLLKLSMNGQIKWAEAIGSGSKEAITGDKALSVTHDGGAVLAGYIDRYDGNGQDVLLVKVNDIGQLEWARSYGGTGTDIGWMPEETSDSGFITASYSSSFSQQDKDGFLIRTDANGILKWSKIYGGDNEERTGCILQDSLNSIAFCGWTSSFNVQQAAIYVVKTDSSGYSGCEDKSVEPVIAEPELAVTSIEGLELQLMYVYLSEFPVSANSIDAADIAIYNISSAHIDINKNANPIPKSFNLYQNYPNPFNPGTTIEYSIPRTSPVSLRIFNVNGQEVRTLLADKIIPVGNYKSEWDGKDNQGSSVASGTYFYQLKTEGFIKTREMIHIK